MTTASRRKTATTNCPAAAAHPTAAAPSTERQSESEFKHPFADKWTSLCWLEPSRQRGDCAGRAKGVASLCDARGTSGLRPRSVADGCVFQDLSTLDGCACQHAQPSPEMEGGLCPGPVLCAAIDVPDRCMRMS